MTNPEPVLKNLRIYLSFAEEDRQRVRELEARLRRDGFQTWFDENDLPLGTNWQTEIRTALPSCDVFLSCISKSSMAREGFYDVEIAQALQERESRPHFILPVRFDNCELPEPYHDLNLAYADLFEVGGLERLLRDLTRRAARRQEKGRDGRRAAGASDDSIPPVRILHLTDLHLTGADSVPALLTPLYQDLQFGLKTSSIDYLVVSGDLSDKCNEPGYTKAGDLILDLQEKLKVPPARCVLVPGNHDVVQELRSFDLKESASTGDDSVKALAGETAVYLTPNPATYRDRFRRFTDTYSRVMGAPYDAEPAKQWVVSPFADTRIQFLALNSAWQIDRFRPKRSSIHGDALAQGLAAMNSRPDYLGIAVWHHAVTGNDKIHDVGFLDLLSQSGVKICLHGDVHEFRRDMTSPYTSTGMHVIGGGSLAARPEDRPPSIPRMYNLIEIQRDHSKVRVRTRKQDAPGTAFIPYGLWPVPGLPDQDQLRGDYEFGIASARAVESA